MTNTDFCKSLKYDKKTQGSDSLGVLSPNGIGKDEFWQACVQGKSGIDLILTFYTSDLAAKIAAQILYFNPLEYISRQVTKRTDRFVHFGLAA